VYQIFAKFKKKMHVSGGLIPYAVTFGCCTAQTHQPSDLMLAHGMRLEKLTRLVSTRNCHFADDFSSLPPLNSPFS
jgi:hypothetical protein